MLSIRASLRTTAPALVAVLAAAVPGIALRQPSPVKPMYRFVPNQVIVRFDDGAAPEARAAVHAASKAAVVESIPEIGADLVRVAGDPRIAAAAYRRLPGVTDAEPNYTGRTAAAPPPSRANDPLVRGIGPTWADRQWYLTRIAAPTAWTIYPRVYYSARTKPPRDAVKVAVLDTWIDTEHNDWRNAGGSSVDNARGGQLDLADARSFVDRAALRGPNDWHGTHVAGIIGASTDNSLDMAGIAYGAQIMPVAVADGGGHTNAFRLAAGISWAASRGAKVINISLTIRAETDGVDTLRAAVTRAVAGGAVVIAALGNGGGDDAEYPAGFAAENPGVAAIGATSLFDTRAACSKKGRHITVSAPGEAMWGLDPQNHAVGADHTIRRETCGTSFATAVVSGVSALVAARYKNIRPAAIVKRLVDGADDIGPAGRDDDTGAGRVNAERALWPGGGPGTKWASIPVVDSGRVTVAAFGQSAAGVARAEVLVDGMVRGRGVRTAAADGAFSGRVEAITASIDVTNLAEGPHDVFVRAQDRKGAWGPAAAGALFVDRSNPSVSSPRTWPTDSGVIYPDDNPKIRFQISDTWSKTMNVKVVLLDASLVPAVTLIFPALPTMLVELQWKEYFERAAGGPILPGAYRVIVTVRDLAGHEIYTEAPVVVLPTGRMLPSPGESSGPGGLPIPPVSTRLLPTSQPSTTATPTTTPSGIF